MAITTRQKKIIAGLIGVVTITGAIAYWQYQKLMNYLLTFRAIKIKKISLTLFDFDLYFNFENKGDISYTIEKQIYDVYLNNVFVTRLSNASPTFIKANAISPLGLNVRFNPRQAFEKLGVNLSTILKGNDKLMIKIDMKLKLKIWLFSFTIPYVYENTLKNMMTA